MPQAARNITTDASMMIGDAQEFFDIHPEASKHYQHFDQQGRKNDGARMRIAADDQEARAQIDELTAEEGRMGVEYDRTGHPFKTDKNGKRIDIDWRASYRSRRARLSASVAANALERKKIGRNEVEALRPFIASIRRAYRSVEMPPIGDERNPVVIVRERERGLDEVLDEERDIQNANRTDAEVDAIARTDYKLRKAAGAVKFGQVTQGGTIRYNGKFSPSNPGARLQFPTVAATIHSGEAHSLFVEVDDTLNFLFWLDDDERILAKILKAAREANAGKRQISEADKVQMLREIAVKKLAAQRHLEVAYRHAEAQGFAIKRRELPPEVLLWIERDTGTRATPTKVISSAEPNFEDDADEGHDA